LIGGEAMQNKPKRSNRNSGTPGPKPEVLKIGIKWQDAVKQSMLKKRPPNGWPK
jgi:hypothetical protein